MKKQNKVFLITIIVIISLVIVLLPINILGEKLGFFSLTLKDNYQSYQEKEENNIIDVYENLVYKFENKIENILTNYFPFYYSLTSSKSKIDYSLNCLIEDNVPIMKKGDEYYYYDSINDFYYSSFVFTDEEFKKRIDKQADFFNEIASKYDTSMYLIPTLALTNIKENNNHEYLELFISKLNNINYDLLDYSTIQEYKNYFYATDHHWKSEGALVGYYDITRLLGVNSIGGLNVNEIDDVKFFGSKAKKALTLKTYDYLTDIDIKLEYDVNNNSEYFKPRKITEDKGNIYKDYYIQYFNGQYTELVYDYHDESKENLLILCDSFAWPIDYLIASSFNKTYVYNFRYTNDALNLDEYIKNNDIDKVLFLYDANSLAFDGDNYNYGEKIK